MSWFLVAVFVTIYAQSKSPLKELIMKKRKAEQEIQENWKSFTWSALKHWNRLHGLKQSMCVHLAYLGQLVKKSTKQAKRYVSVEENKMNSLIIQHYIKFALPQNT